MGQWVCYRWGRTTASWNLGACPHARAPPVAAVAPGLLCSPAAWLCLALAPPSALALLSASLPAYVCFLRFGFRLCAHI